MVLEGGESVAGDSDPFFSFLQAKTADSTNNKSMVVRILISTLAGLAVDLRAKTHVGAPIDYFLTIIIANAYLIIQTQNFDASLSK